MGYSQINNLTISTAKIASVTFKYTILLGAILNCGGTVNQVLTFIFMKSMSIIVHY